ncbi:MAG: hypothetical protein BGO69_19895 [Bacteroidetes bacterium 46-16]|nr:MAG: hypothetical protein BGO69_19895 [Bacteroidetes bacterium 46-16]
MNKLTLSFAVVTLFFCVPGADAQGTSSKGTGSTHIVHAPAWKPIFEKDVLWQKRVWREIDANETNNIAFMYANSGQHGVNLFDALQEGVKEGAIKAYDPVDDRFTKEMGVADLRAVLKPRTINEKAVNALTGKTETQSISMNFDPAMVYKYWIKEDWIFDKVQNKMVIHIIGLAPVVAYLSDDGTSTSYRPLFWVYYPDARKLLATKAVYYSITDDSLTWDDLFENRSFTSHVTKISEKSNYESK